MATSAIYRDLSGATDNGKFTFSCWFKPAKPGAGGKLYHNKVDASNQATIHLESNGTVEFMTISSGVGVGYLKTQMAFDDTNAWYHLVCVTDFTNGTADDRMKMWVNGVRQTVWNSSGNPGTTDTNNFVTNTTTNGNAIGANVSDGNSYFEGSMSHVIAIYGNNYDASYFGEFEDNVWKIKTNPSVTYDAKGYYLKMEDSTNLDLDSSGNSIAFTTAGNLMANKDNPSNNLCNVNWQAKGMVDTTSDSNKNCGNTVLIQQSSFRANVGSLPVSAGKWYAEFKLRTASGTSGYDGIGVLNINPNPGDMSNQDPIRIGTYTNGVSYLSDGSVAKGNSTVRTDSSFTTGDIISIAMDLDNGFIYWAKNNTWQNSGDPTSGATGTGGYAISNILDSGSFGATDPGSYVMGVTGRSSSSAPYFDINWGGGWFDTTAISSPNADSSGYGAFNYTPPTNFLTICTNNISTNG